MSEARWWDGLRPLDPVGSIKMKFAVIIVSGSVLTAAGAGYGFTVLGWRLRYSLLAATLFSLAVSQVLARGMTSPLRQMTAAARELAAGRPATPVHGASRDEVGQLATAFTMMASELAAVDGQRRQLLANVSHELRTPVAALRAQLENLADGVRPTDPEALAEVLQQVERLGALVDDLLDLARADGGAVRLERRSVPVAALLADVVREVRAARPGPVVSVRVSPSTLQVKADPHRFGQVVTNLVDNASRFARSRVDVEAFTGSSGGLVLEVTDDGPGIPPDRWETVFERFRGATGEIATQPLQGPAPGRRVDGDTELSGRPAPGRRVDGDTELSGRPAPGRRVDGDTELSGRPAPGRRVDGGTGLGLAIARWAVVLHGGSIAVAPAPDGGCRIRVELPAPPEQSAEQSPQDLHNSST